MSGKVIVIDPFLTQNPKTPAQYKNLDALGKVDLILVTHAHGDHLGDAPDLAKKNNAPIVGPGGPEPVAAHARRAAGQSRAAHEQGRRVTPLGPDIKITMTRAEHSSELVWKNPATGKDGDARGRRAHGFIIEFENGFKLYHMGDTGRLRRHEVHRRLLQAGPHHDSHRRPLRDEPPGRRGRHRDLIKPKHAIPIHYGTFPVLKGTPEEYIQALGQTSTKVYPINPGDKLTFP